MKSTLVTPWEDQFYDPSLFDAAAGDPYSADIEEIYFQLIGDFPQKKIVEYGCGTGRVILKLLNKGHTVTGVDISKPMLARLKEKVEYLPADLKSRIRVMRADVQDMEMPDTYQVAIAVDDFATHFLEKERLIQMFRKIASSLEPGGLFITDLRTRDPEKLRRAQSEYPKNMYTYGIVHNVRVDEDVYSASMKYWEDYDNESRVLCSQQVFDFIRENGEVEKTVYKTLRQKLHTKQQLTIIAGEAKFRLQQFLPFDAKKDENAGVYLFQLKD